MNTKQTFLLFFIFTTFTLSAQQAKDNYWVFTGSLGQRNITAKVAHFIGNDLLWIDEKGFFKEKKIVNRVPVVFYIANSQVKNKINIENNQLNELILKK